MFPHRHPYPPFVPTGTEKLIVGTLPPPRFSVGTLFTEDVDFCYGSKYGLLWPILERIFGVELSYENTYHAIEQRKRLLQDHKLGICDMVSKCERTSVNASDLGMQSIELRDLLGLLKECLSINTVLFMGGNTKNGPEFLFRKQLKDRDLSLMKIRSKDPRIHELKLNNRIITCVSLISPSNAANRSIGGHAHYKKMKAADESYSTLDFRVEQYQRFIS